MEPENQCDAARCYYPSCQKHAELAFVFGGTFQENCEWVELDEVAE